MRTLHRDLLLPCGFLPTTEFEEDAQKKDHCRPRTRAQSRAEDAAEAEANYYCSESGSEYVHLVPEDSMEFTTRVISDGRLIHHSECLLDTRNLPVVESASSEAIVLDQSAVNTPAEQNSTCDEVEKNSPAMCQSEPEASDVEPEMNTEDELSKVTLEKISSEPSELPDESFQDQVRSSCE